MNKLALQPSHGATAAVSTIPEVTLREVGTMLVRRRSVIFTTMVVFLLLGTSALVLSTRRYRSVGEIELQKDSAGSLGIQTGSADAPSDALEVNMIIQTQAKILQSDSLALKVIEDLHLDQTQDFKPRTNFLSSILGCFSAKVPADPQGASLENSPHRRNQVLRVFHRHLTVKPIAGTRLIDVEYLSPDPQLAAAVVNDLLQGLIEKGFQARYSATMQASSWLGNQLEELRGQTRELQQRVVKLQQESGVFALGEVDKDGKNQVYSPTLEKLQMATEAEAQAQSNLILKGAINDVVQSGSAELLSSLAGSSIAGSTSPSGVASSLSLLQNLRLQEANTQAQLQELSSKFGPNYPKLGEVRASLLGTQKAIHDEVKRVGQRAHNDYVVAQQAEDHTRRDFETDKREAEGLNNKTIEYQMVRQEADQTRALYDDMLRHLKESGLLSGLRSTNISVVDWAKASDTPAKPAGLLYLSGSLFAGLIFGSLAALIRDVTDTRIHDLRDLSRELGHMPLCVLPYEQMPRKVVADTTWAAQPPEPVLKMPQSHFVESLRALRTSLLLSRMGEPPCLVLVTSPLQGEGKSLISWNLAVLFAQQGKRVLLCDADLRHPSLHHHLQVNPEKGLTSLLRESDGDGRSVILPASQVSGLFLLPAGSRELSGASGAELLASHRMRELVKLWESQYDCVIFDAPPVLHLSDAVVLSSMMDSVLLIAWHQKTPLAALEESYRKLESVQSMGSRKINIVINAAKVHSLPYPYKEREVAKAS